VPEVLDIEPVPGSRINLEDDLPGGVNNLAGVIDHRSPKSGGVAPDRHYLTTDISLERFIEEERQQHDVVEGCIGTEASEWQLLGTELLECPVDQFITTPVVMGLDDLSSFFQVFQSGHFQKLIDVLSLADVGIEYLVGAGELHEQLPILTEGPDIERSPELVPSPPAVPEFNILPDLVVVLMPLPGGGIHAGHVVLDVGEETATADEPDTKIIEQPEKFLVEEPAVEPDDDRHIIPISLLNQVNDMLHRFKHGVSMVAMFASPTEDRINQVGSPHHLQWRKPFHPSLVGWFNCFTLLRSGVVHRHRIDTQHDHLRLLDPQSPQEQLLEQTAEEIDPVH